MELEFDALTRRYGPVVALDELSFRIPAGQVVGFLGPNGAGKTTAMRAVFGLVALDAGEVRWNGRRVAEDDLRRFGYLPEERGLYPGMTVADHLVYLATLHGIAPAAARSATGEWLERLGLSERAGSKVETLSLGNAQRVQLIAALVHEPDVLILDEPLSGLDPAGIDTVGAVLVERAASGRCVLFSSHQLDLVEDLCESVVIIDHGRLVVQGSVDELSSAGRRRLVVRVEGDRTGDWARSIPGVSISGLDGGAVRLLLDGQADSQEVLAKAAAAGRVTEFSFARRRLSEVFREELR